MGLTDQLILMCQNLFASSTRRTVAIFRARRLDAFRMDENGSIIKETNHAGGILGGMSDGSDILLRATIKPTPSIAALQQTVNKNGENIDVNIKGRHDPIIVPRAVVVVESMAAITIVDAMFANMSARMDSLERFYK